MSDPTKSISDQTPTDPSPANDLRIGPPERVPHTDSRSTDSRSTDLHNLRGATVVNQNVVGQNVPGQNLPGQSLPDQDVPRWVAEATRAPGPPTSNAYGPSAFHQPGDQPGVGAGNPYGPAQPSSSLLPLSTMSEIGTKKLVAGLLAIFLGSFGAHKFYLGRTGSGLVMLIVNLGGWLLAGVVTLITFGIAGLIFLPLMSLVATALAVIGLIEGIVYLTRSDDEFNQTYMVGRKDWF